MGWSCTGPPSVSNLLASEFVRKANTYDAVLAGRGIGCVGLQYGQAVEVCGDLHVHVNSAEVRGCYRDSDKAAKYLVGGRLNHNARQRGASVSCTSLHSLSPCVGKRRTAERYRRIPCGSESAKKAARSTQTTCIDIIFHECQRGHLRTRISVVAVSL